MKKLQILSAVCLAMAVGARTSFGAFVITEVMSTSGAPAGSLSGLDWFEVTNVGAAPALLDGYSWEDMPVSNDRAVFPNGISVAAGESIIVHQGVAATIAADFRTAWGLNSSVQVLTQTQFTGPNPFSGLGSGGDEVHLFDASSAEVSAVSFGASTSGVSFEWDRTGASLGLSVNGENGAFLSSYGGTASPGASVVPEPATIGLGAIALSCLGARRRKR